MALRSLEDRVVLVTGASRGLGVDIARAFAARGARLALAARSAEALEQVRDELLSSGRRAIAVPCDVGDLDSSRALVRAVEEQLGPIDVLVNNAGIEEVCDFEGMTPERIEAIVRVNVLGLIWLSRLVVPSMIERGAGHIVNVASLAGLVAVPHNAVYSATKHAVVGVSRSLRLELADHGVGVSVVCPGFVKGGMFLEWGRKPPAMAGWVTSREVARATVRSVRRDQAEVVVTKGLGRIADWFQAVSPGLSGSMLRWSGMVGFLREQARLNGARGE